MSTKKNKPVSGTVTVKPLNGDLPLTVKYVVEKTNEDVSRACAAVFHSTQGQVATVSVDAIDAKGLQSLPLTPHLLTQFGQLTASIQQQLKSFHDKVDVARQNFLSDMQEAEDQLLNCNA